MAFARVVNDVFGNRLLITKDALVVFKCCKVTINHLSMISYSDLNVSNFIKVFAIVIIITANLRAVAILFSTLRSIASLISLSKDISWDFKSLLGAPA